MSCIVPEIYFTAELNAGAQWILLKILYDGGQVQNCAWTRVFHLFRNTKYIEAVEIYLSKELKSSSSHRRKEITGNGKCFVVFVFLCIQLISKLFYM